MSELLDKKHCEELCALVKKRSLPGIKVTKLISTSLDTYYATGY
jgi:hypothetical protein